MRQLSMTLITADAWMCLGLTRYDKISAFCIAIAMLYSMYLLEIWRLHMASIYRMRYTPWQLGRVDSGSSRVDAYGDDLMAAK